MRCVIIVSNDGGDGVKPARNPGGLLHQGPGVVDIRDSGVKKFPTPTGSYRCSRKEGSNYIEMVQTSFKQA